MLEKENLVGESNEKMLDHIFACHEELRRIRKELVELSKPSTNTRIKQFPKSTEIWNHVTSFLVWNPEYNFEHTRKIAELVSKYISRKQLNA